MSLVCSRFFNNISGRSKIIEMDFSSLWPNGFIFLIIFNKYHDDPSLIGNMAGTMHLFNVVCNCNNRTGTGIMASGGFLYVNACTVNNANTAIEVNSTSVISVFSVSGTGNTIAFRSSVGLLIIASGTIAATTRRQVANGGIISEGGVVYTS